MEMFIAQCDKKCSYRKFLLATWQGAGRDLYNPSQIVKTNGWWTRPYYLVYRDNYQASFRQCKCPAQQRLIWIRILAQRRKYNNGNNRTLPAGTLCDCAGGIIVWGKIKSTPLKRRRALQYAYYLSSSNLFRISFSRSVSENEMKYRKLLGREGEMIERSSIALIWISKGGHMKI